MNNLEYNARFTNRLKPPADQTGSIIYEVDPPGKGLIHRLSITGSFSHEPGTGGDDSFRILYAVDRPEIWQFLWGITAEELDNGLAHISGKKEKYGQHWRYDKTVEAHSDKPCRKGYVKFEISRAHRATLNTLKIYAFYEPERAVDPPHPEDIVITHIWSENDSLFTHRETLRSQEHTYAISVSAAGDSIVNKSIALEMKNTGQ